MLLLHADGNEYCVYQLRVLLTKQSYKSSKRQNIQKLTCLRNSKPESCTFSETDAHDVCHVTIPGKPWAPVSNVDALMASHVISVCISAMYMNGYNMIGVADLEVRPSFTILGYEHTNCLH